MLGLLISALTAHGSNSDLCEKPESGASSLIRNVCEEMRNEIMESFDFKNVSSEADSQLSKIGAIPLIEASREAFSKLPQLRKEKNALSDSLRIAVKSEKFIEANELNIKKKELDKKIEALEYLIISNNAELEKMAKENGLDYRTSHVSTGESGFYRNGDYISPQGFVFKKEIPVGDRIQIGEGYYKKKYKNLLILKTSIGETEFSFSDDEFSRKPQYESIVSAELLIQKVLEENGCK